MGISSDGIVAWGYDLGDPEEWDYELDEDKLDELSDTKPVRLELHCSYEYPMYFVTISESVISASRGYPKVFDPYIAEGRYEEWEGELAEYARENGLPAPDNVGWFVFSLYG